MECTRLVLLSAFLLAATPALGHTLSPVHQLNLVKLDEGLLDEVQQIRKDLAILQARTAFQGKFFVHEGRDYHVNTESEVSWEDAETWCQQRGANLAQPTDNLNTFMKEVAKRCPVKQGNVRVWLGATDLAQEGEWQWVSGRLVDHSNTPWAEGNPSNSGNLEHCMEIQIETFSEVKLKINDNQCTALQYFVCEL